MAKRKTHEEFVAEVKVLVGDEYSVVGTYINTRVKLIMKHNKCGYTYEITPHHFLKQVSGCAYCAKRGKKTTKVFVEEVNKLEGNSYKVLSEYKNARTKIKMIHKECGLIYQVTPDGFLRGRRCPDCSKLISSSKQRKDHNDFLIEVRSRFKDEFEIISKYETAKKKVDVKHVVCGHIYLVRPNNLLSGFGCPICKESKGERKIREWLYAKGIDCLSQHPIKYSSNKRPLFLDFFVQGVAIEYDGEQHYIEKEFFGGESALRSTRKRDAIKTKYCADNNIPLIRIPYWEYDNIDAILTEKLLPLLYNADKQNAS